MGAPIRRDIAEIWVASGLVVAAAAVSLVVAWGPCGLLGASLALLMGTIAVADLRSFTIPDTANAASLLLALVHSVVCNPGAWIEALAWAVLAALGLALAFLALREIHMRLRGLEGLGLGDVKLAAVAGAWLNWVTIPLV